jgi:hypothetical protein
MSQELAIDDTVRELWHNRQNGSHCLLANDRRYISKASDLMQS